eukprot:3735194-Amphidinium_carterae.1
MSRGRTIYSQEGKGLTEKGIEGFWGFKFRPCSARFSHVRTFFLEVVTLFQKPRIYPHPSPIP